jgi:RNA polymerase sigma-70 factor (ECF subfamily)
MTDGQLLERFLCSRDEAAFEALVRRHGPMVLGVCRRILGNGHDAEDAFQATFLVLARKAAAIMPREMIGNWLYGVASNIARKAKATTLRRRLRERQVEPMPEPPAANDIVADDLIRLLDDELSRLPDRYRVPLVLCELEGKTYQEAARQIGVTAGTISVRLVRARGMLAKRLARRGLAVSLASLALVLPKTAASAPVHAALLTATLQACGPTSAALATVLVSERVTALTQEFLKSMLLSKLKMATPLLLAVAVGIGACGLIYQGHAAQSATSRPNPQTTTQVPSRRPRDRATMNELEKLQGTWILTAWQQGGRAEIKAGSKSDKSKPLGTDGRLKIDGNKLTFCPPGTGGKAIWSAMLQIDPAQKPKAMDWVEFTRLQDNKREGNLTGIYDLTGSILTFCYGNPRSGAFELKPDRELDERKLVFKREKP